MKPLQNVMLALASTLIIFASAYAVGWVVEQQLIQQREDELLQFNRDFLGPEKPRAAQAMVRKARSSAPIR
jgi:hypothetical protein